MKVFFSLFLLCISLLSAEIDVKLFDNADKENYYDEIKKSIDYAASQGTSSEEIVKEERTQLSRLRDAASNKVHIDRYDLNILKNKTIETEEYYNAIHTLALLKYRQEQSADASSEMQPKLLFLKKAIEDITDEEKPKLLSYQLQFSYYKIQQKNIEEKISLIQAHQKEISNLLSTSLASVNCNNEESISSKLITLEKDLEETVQEKISQKLELEKAFIEESDKIEVIKKKIQFSDAKYQEYLCEKILLKVQESICVLLKGNSTGFYKNITDLNAIIPKLSVDKEKEIYSQELEILKNISKIKFGATKLFFGATSQESKKVLISIGEFFTSPIFIYNERPISLLSLSKSIVLLFLGFVLGRLYKGWIKKISLTWTHVSMMSIRLASNLGYYIIILLFFIIALGSLGIDMTSISLIAGALSIGIGFGLQTVVSNFIAGIIIMFERTIRIGDTIEINDIVLGVVTDIRIRSTTVKTFDNIDIVVPNSSFIQNNVVNWTLDDKIRRLLIPFSVAYDTEVDDVRNAVLGALSASDLMYINNDNERKADIRMTLMNSSSVDFELLVWVVWDPKKKHMSLKSDFLILIYNALRANNIAIPFPQLDLHMKEKV